MYSLATLAEAAGGSVIGKGDLIITHLITDSRTSAVSHGNLFIALSGERHNGHHYIAELYRRGVRAFLVSEMHEAFRFYSGAGFIVCENTLAALQKIAGYHRQQINCEVLAITGSNGKTIIKEWLFHCLGDFMQVTRSPKSYNSQIGVPLSLWLLNNKTTLAIIEAGISKPGEMMRLQQIINPHAGIMTNIGEAHQENFSTREEKAREKLRLFLSARLIVYCRDHDLIHREIAQTEFSGPMRIFNWSESAEADLLLKNRRLLSGKTCFEAVFQDRELAGSIPFEDEASFENAAHCLAYMLAMGVHRQTISEKLATLPVVAMRLEQKSAINGCTLINDSYNADINSLGIALDVLNRQARHSRKTLILSDILQSGAGELELYSQVAVLVETCGIGRLIGIGPALSRNKSLFGPGAVFFQDTDAFLDAFRPADFTDEAILLKGSRQFAFEKITALLEEKRHTTRLEINLDALAHNLNHYRSLLLPGTMTMVMVKALGYGSGGPEVAALLQYQRVNYLGVAFADEGVALRRAGIILPIMVMNPEPETFDLMISYRLEPEIYNFRTLRLFSAAVLKNQEVDYPVHIKIDTGMHRLGFTENEIEQLGNELGKLQWLRVISAFSHLAATDEPIHDSFTLKQIDAFGRAAGLLSQSLGMPLIRHILNTSGIERFPQAQFEMVRLGIGLYGVSSFISDKLKTVTTLKSSILQIKQLKHGDTVGYSRAGLVDKPIRIAVVPLGYADGLNRRLSNGNGRFLINGKYAPIIGNICMDMTIADVTGLDASEGDDVIVFGGDLPVQEMAERLHTIPYEILTGVSERVKRIYLQE